MTQENMDRIVGRISNGELTPTAAFANAVRDGTGENRDLYDNREHGLDDVPEEHLGMYLD